MGAAASHPLWDEMQCSAGILKRSSASLFIDVTWRQLSMCNPNLRAPRMGFLCVTGPAAWSNAVNGPLDCQKHGSRMLRWANCNSAQHAHTSRSLDACFLFVFPRSSDDSRSPSQRLSKQIVRVSNTNHLGQTDRKALFVLERETPSTRRPPRRDWRLGPSDMAKISSWYFFDINMYRDIPLMGILHVC